MSSADLLERLADAQVQLNEYARQLFADPLFEPAREQRTARLVQVSMPQLGLAHGGRFDDVVRAATSAGLRLCPLEVAPHLRLQYLDQPIGSYLTVASPELHPGTEEPNGFYLRHLDDGLWLRGYEAGPENVYEPDFTDFVFEVS